MTDVVAETRLVERFSRVLIGAVAIVTDERGQVIFIRQPRGPFAGSWLLPGGGLELDESAIDAARRETLEETGVLVEDLRYVGTYEVLGSWPHGPFHFILLAFAGAARSGVQHGDPGADEGEMCWARPTDLDLHATDLMMLNDAGVASYTDDEIRQALEAGNVRMVRYPS